MKKQAEKTEKLTLKKEVLKALAGVRTGIKAGLGTQQCHPETGYSRCIPCEQ